MAPASSPLLAPADLPRTQEGKRNFAWSALHPGEKPSSADTLPETGGGFGALLDIVNPLQHIPIVGSIYRALTGDTLSAPGRILGDLLFGGPIGFLAGIASTLAEEVAAPATVAAATTAYNRAATATTASRTTTLQI